MKTCETCKYWNISYNVVNNISDCDRVDCTSDNAKSFKIDVFVHDDSGLDVVLMTGKDFGCIHYDKKIIPYQTDSTGKCAVYAGKQLIAISVLGQNGYEVKILQGMDRDETIKKICEDCPEFAEANDIDENYLPKLMSSKFAEKYMIKYNNLR
jgi:hypothetical protein